MQYVSLPQIDLPSLFKACQLKPLVSLGSKLNETKKSHTQHLRIRNCDSLSMALVSSQFMGTWGIPLFRIINRHTLKPRDILNNNTINNLSRTLHVQTTHEKQHKTSKKIK